MSTNAEQVNETLDGFIQESIKHPPTSLEELEALYDEYVGIETRTRELSTVIDRAIVKLTATKVTKYEMAERLGITWRAVDNRYKKAIRAATL